MRSRTLRILIILTLLTSVFGASFSPFAGTVGAAEPPSKSKDESRPEGRVVRPGANQAGIAAPGGQTAVGWGYNDELWLCNGDFEGDDVFAPKPNIYLSGVTAVAAGYYHALYLLSDGTVYGCGDDDDGQLGNGRDEGDDYGAPQQVLGVCPSASPAPSPSPSPTAAQCGYLTNIAAIAAGDDHSLALDKDGNAYTWGDNGNGELGIGINGDERTAPVKVQGLPKIVQIVGGDDFSIALAEDGKVYGWGRNNQGQLGIGNNAGQPDTAPSTTGANCTCYTYPVMATGLPKIVQIAAGQEGDHVLALDENGHVWAWGSNDDGQLGRGTTSAFESTPAEVLVAGVGSAPLAGVALPDAAHPEFERIAANDYNSYAVMADGSVVAWGSNSYGALGIGDEDGQPDTAPSTTGADCDCYTYPVTVHGVDNVGTLGNIVSLGSGGDETAYAISADQHLYAWGYNGYGQLGIGTDGDDRSTPVMVLGASGNGALSNVLAVSASNNDWVIAVLAAPAAQYAITATVSGSGTITPAGTTTYTSGDVASYTATPAGGQTFIGWTLDGQYVGYANPLAITVTANHTLVATFVATPTFSDIGGLSAADQQSITFLAALGIINPNGVNGSGQFQPAQDVKRAEIAAFVARVFGWQDEFHGNDFPDKCDANGQNCVDDELWNNVAALADYGVVGGYTDPATCQSAGTTTPCYLPRDTVQRVQVVSVVARAFIKEPALRPTGFWDRLAADGAQYTNVPNTGTQRSDLTTYRANVGTVPGQTSDANFADPTGNGKRLYVVQVLYTAFNAQFGVDRVP